MFYSLCSFIIFFFLCLSLTTELLDIRLLTAKRKRDDTADMHIRAIDVHIKVQFLTSSLDVPETFLEVRTSTTDPDLDLVLAE